MQGRKISFTTPYEVLEIPGGTPKHELMIKKYNRIKIPPGFHEPVGLSLWSPLHQQYRHEEVNSPPTNNSQIIGTV